MAGTIEVKRSGKQFMFNVKSTNGRVILTSERYKSKASALNGVKSVKANARKKASYERAKATNGKTYFRIKAKNNEVIGRSQMYASSSGVSAGIASLQKNAPGGKVIDLT